MEKIVSGTPVVLMEKKTDTISKITNHDGFCQRARMFQVDMSTPEKPENYIRAAIIKSAVKEALVHGDKNPKDIMEYMGTRYEECLFKNFQQKRIMLLWDHRRVMRYLQDEVRKPVFVKGQDVRVGSHKFLVKPDFCFTDGDGKAEYVMLKIGKPDVTKRGRKNSEIRDLRLYAMVLAARQAGFKEITASYYFLKKGSDTQNWMQCEQAFFGGDNVVSMTDIYDGRPNSLDSQMEPLVRMLDEGMPPENMCEQDCKACEKQDLCRYTPPPMRVIKEPVVRSAADVTLTPAQEQAISVDHGIYRINAGAGAGKTMVVAFHIKALLEKGVRPEEICCITFTNAGAREMLHRAELYAGRELTGMYIQTFNAFEDDIVKDCWKELGFARKPIVIDDVERYSIIAGLLNRNPIYEWTGNSFLNFTSTKGSYGGAKGALKIAADVFRIIKKSGVPAKDIQPEAVREATGKTDMSDAAIRKLILLYDQYDGELKRRGLIEFDDQEILTFRILDRFPDYLSEHYSFRHIVVDEFQDTSEGQIELVKRFCAMPTFESLMVIGDDSQAIFGFRDTTPKFIIHFEKYIGQPVKDIMLVENHRSTPEIIGFANRINDMNREKVNKSLVATRPHGLPVIVNGFYNKIDEQRYIVEGIKAHLANGTKPEDIAVIAYTKAELKVIADLLTKENIPSMFGAPELLLENSRIRAVIAFAKAVKDPGDRKDVLIAANALVGGNLMDMGDGAVQNQAGAVWQMAEDIRNAYGLKEKKELFLRYIDAISFGDEAIIHFSDSLENKDFDEILAYCGDFESYGEEAAFKREEEYPGVILVTAHSSKGLEWPVVYNTVSKYQRNEQMKAETVEEIRRLLFVSATRARDELYITGQYSIGPAYQMPVINRFLKEAFQAAGKTFSPQFE